MTQSIENPVQKADVFIGSVLATIGGIFWWSSGHIEVDPDDWGIGPRLFPQVISVAMFILGSALAARSAAGWLGRGVRSLSAGESQETTRFLKGVLPLVVTAFFYVAMIGWVQFLIPTIIAMAIVLYLFGNRGPVTLGVVPFLTGIGYYIVFFGILRLYEAPGTLIQFESSWLFTPIQSFLGWR